MNPFLCPVCNKGILFEVIQIHDVEISGKMTTVTTIFSKCNSCGIEQANSEQMLHNIMHIKALRRGGVYIPTPGPWSIEEHGGGYALYSNRTDHTHGLNLLHITEPDWNFETNKRLIEAAPELLSLVEDVLLNYDIAPDGGNWEEKSRKSIE